MQTKFDKTVLYDHPSGIAGLKAWWYRLTTPAEPAIGAPLQQRERMRHARFTSIILLILFILNIPSVPPAFIGTNPALLFILIFLFISTIVAALFNRRGMIYTAGAIIVVTYSLGTMMNIVTTPGGLQLTVIPLFTLLLIPEILSAAMLPAGCVFISASINILFCFLAVTFMPRSPAVNQYMPVIYSNGVFLVATVQMVIASIAFLWTSSLQKAIKARDQAEEIARLEEDLSEQTMQMAQQKDRLERSIELIVQTQSRVANGDLNARAPLTSENVLWSVAGTLNNMITRLQRSRMVEHELEQTKVSATQLIIVLRSRRTGRPAPNYSRTGTIIDPIAMEIFAPMNTPHASDDESCSGR